MRARNLLIGYGCLTVAALGFFQHYRLNKKSERLPAASTLSLPEIVHKPVNSCATLYKVICKRNSETVDPTGFVREDINGELKALRIYEEIIRKYPDLNIDQIDEKLVTEIYTPKRRQRIESAFRWV